MDLLITIDTGGPSPVVIDKRTHPPSPLFDEAVSHALELMDGLDLASIAPYMRAAVHHMIDPVNNALILAVWATSKGTDTGTPETVEHTLRWLWANAVRHPKAVLRIL